MDLIFVAHQINNSEGGEEKEHAESEVSAPEDDNTPLIIIKEMLASNYGFLRNQFYCCFFLPWATAYHHLNISAQ